MVGWFALLPSPFSLLTCYLQPMRPSHLFLVVVALAACSGGGSRTRYAAPETYAAEPAYDTLVAPVVHVSEAAPRSDGTWVLLGVEEMTVLVADFAADTVTPHPGITREEVPGAVSLMAAGDTIYLSDYGLRRVTGWLPDGRRVDAVPVPDAARGSYPRARDAAGQWYFEMPARPGPDGRGVLDSGAVVRANSAITNFDTVARVSPPAVMEVEQNGRRRLAQLQLAGRDRWGVLANGTVWLGRIAQNQVFWFPPDGSEPLSTDPLPDPIVTVTDMDRRIYIRRYPEEQRPALEQSVFAAVKPPFERAFADRRGRVWLFKSAPALDSVRTFQVSDTTGWVLSVTVRSYGEALAISDTEILMGEEFPEGIRLLKFTIPEQARP